ncbi:uncharacterized protein EI97DRAFT_434682 [Westerdykella ornata]|uniref:Uncharacterized protein n=1 Tax=Westerdykella ornata TaxID=318751 RepID=A0A6A6JGL9_WESOR|nr:uncharacterized protein EI97DRAFT_434682 [Westerdykella ornata]KAF2275118.1 hypothetical protein EI97DRAFT_434682 [Westerdykella ornata]
MYTSIVCSRITAGCVASLKFENKPGALRQTRESTIRHSTVSATNTARLRATPRPFPRRGSAAAKRVVIGPTQISSSG